MIIFDTCEQAVEWLNNNFKGYFAGSETAEECWYDTGIFITSDGCYERPDYSPRKIAGGKSPNHGKYGIWVRYYYYKGTFHAPKDQYLTRD